MTAPAAARAPVGPHQIDAAGRAALYALLATGFATPNPRSRRLIAETLLPACASLRLPPPVGDLVRSACRAFPADPEAIVEAHLALFPPIASRDAPGYETAYRGDDLFRQVELLADVAGFYRAHGVRAGGPERERPDHVVVELEFMSLLARKELVALQAGHDERVSIVRASAAAFLRDHLACWGPAFGLRAAAVAEIPWYRELGSLLAAWIEWDASVMGVEPVEHAAEPVPPPPPDDGACGPCPVGGSM